MNDLLKEWKTSLTGAFLILVWLAVVLQMPDKISDPLIALLLLGGLTLLKARDWAGKTPKE